MEIVLEKIIAFGLKVLADTGTEIIDERKQQGGKQIFMKEGALGDVDNCTSLVEVCAGEKCLLIKNLFYLYATWVLNYGLGEEIYILIAEYPLEGNDLEPKDQG